jgi:Mg-chelatase subunit ChlI
MIREILIKGKRGFGKTVFSNDPKELIKKVVALIKDNERIIHSPGAFRNNHHVSG